MMKYLMLLIAASCAWNRQDLKKIERPPEDLVKTFEVKKEVMEKFTEKEVVVENKKEKKKKKLKTKVIVKEIEKITEKKIYPADYPRKYIDFNKKYARAWNEYDPKVFVNEEMEFDISFLGIKVGKVILRTLSSKMIGQKEAFHFRADLKSAPYYSYVYSLDDYIETFIDVKSMLPLKYALIQRESGKSIDDLQVFDHETLKTNYYYKRVKGTEIKQENKEKYMPAYFQDSFSAIQFVRGLPLRMNETYEFPLLNRTKIKIVKYTVVGIENIKVNDKKISSLKLKAETRFPGVKEKKGEITLWLSNDRLRKVVKFSANIKIGSVKGELTRYKAGELQ